MAQADLVPTTSRRRFLAVLGFAGAATVTAVTVQAKDETGPFETPAQYLAAMRAIGWEPRAMFQRLADGSAWRMGVIEDPMAGVSVDQTWTKLHAIQIRCPVQLPADVHQGQWWKAVWHHLYDIGLTKAV